MLYGLLIQSVLICSQNCTSITITLEQNQQTEPNRLPPTPLTSHLSAFCFYEFACSGLFAIVGLRQDRSYVGFFNAFFVTQIQTTGMPVTIANITINYL